MKKIILISLMVIAVLSLVLSGCQPVGPAGQAGGAPLIQTPPKSATSCDGDATCEANNLMVNGDAQINGHADIDSATVDDLTVNNNANTRDLTISNNARVDKDVDIFGTLRAWGPVHIGGGGRPGYVQVNGRIFTQRLFADSLEGGMVNITSLSSQATPGITGNAYVCANNVGTLFRSGVPCR